MAAIADALKAPARKVRVGIGDDAAAWKVAPHHVALITTDMLVDGVHFRSALTPPRALGHKALAESLSDIAAMGGVPTVVVVALGLGSYGEEAWVRELYAGMALLARAAGCAIVGGDIVRASTLTLGVTVCGEVRSSRLKLRCGAKVGDLAVVSGPLGLSAAGLRLIDSAGQAAVSPQAAQRLSNAYLKPEPRLREGVYFAARRSVHAMMDISDGLSTDLRRMARASGIDAVIERNRLSADWTLIEAARAVHEDPTELMLNGGDDYELLAAIEPRAYAHVAAGFRHRFGRTPHVAGRFEPGSGRVWMEDAAGRSELIPAGYDHLRKTGL